MLPLLALLACATVDTDTGAVFDLCIGAVEAQCWCYLESEGIEPGDNNAASLHQSCMESAAMDSGRLTECSDLATPAQVDAWIRKADCTDPWAE